MALARHRQHARMDQDTARHAAQFGCLQSRHSVLRKGSSNRLAIARTAVFSGRQGADKALPNTRICSRRRKPFSQRQQVGKIGID